MITGQAGGDGAHQLSVSEPSCQSMSKSAIQPSPSMPGPITIARHGQPDADRTTGNLQVVMRFGTTGELQ